MFGHFFSSEPPFPENSGQAPPAECCVSWWGVLFGKAREFTEPFSVQNEVMSVTAVTSWAGQQALNTVPGTGIVGEMCLLLEASQTVGIV